MHLPGLVHAVRETCAGRFQSNALHRDIELLSILGLIDRFLCRADHLDTVFFQHAFRIELQRTVQCRLPTHRGKHRVGALALNDSRHGLPLHRLDVSGISHGGIGHDRRGVGVHQNDPIALFPECLARLRTGVIEFTGLANHDRARAQNQDALDISTTRHALALPGR